MIAEPKSRLKVWLNRFLSGLIAIVLFVAGTAAYQVRTVQSGSMDPAFQTGSIIFTKNAVDSGKLERGEVITYRSGSGSTVTHRIVDVHRSDGLTMYKTKGDSNNAADLYLVPEDYIEGVYTGVTIPYAGYAVHFLNRGNQLNGIFLLIGAVLLVYALFLLAVGWRQTKEESGILNREVPAKEGRK
ncbi:signal peptidase I [Bacillus marinisedimentorum]|uniref:signal peptidase I n=1 Tax=Bacillus marinisedimentorum TaxID=1821260 RepID=UPI0007E00203|nr:signal peptidase I [Bacillus marinisedimentorum]